jgi:hypothetical protein
MTLTPAGLNSFQRLFLIAKNRTHHLFLDLAGLHVPASSHGFSPNKKQQKKYASLSKGNIVISEAHPSNIACAHRKRVPAVDALMLPIAAVDSCLATWARLGHSQCESSLASTPDIAKNISKDEELFLLDGAQTAKSPHAERGAMLVAAKTMER